MHLSSRKRQVIQRDKKQWQDSLLFDDENISTMYSRVSEQEVLLELRKYREYINKHIQTIYEEIQDGNDLINISVESFGYLPDDELLKQLALYMDRIVISDPLYMYTEEKSSQHNVMNEFFRLNQSSGIDKEKLARDVKYMKSKVNLVAKKFIVFFPITLLHETPNEVPLKYSVTGFSDVLPLELLRFFYNNVLVSNVHIKDGHM